MKKILVLSSALALAQDGLGLDVGGYGLGVVAKKNFGANGRRFFVQGRAGIAHMEIKASFDDLGAEESSDKAYFGAGVGYDINEMFGVSVNYDFHEADFDGLSVDAEVLTLGGEVRF